MPVQKTRATVFHIPGYEQLAFGLGKVRQTMILLNEGRLAFPLYHGTSTLFEHSIRRDGLGGYNPINEHRVLTFLKEIIDRCIEVGALPECGSPFMNDIIEQTHLRGNWRHGSVYLTPSRVRASNHARWNLYGSELLSYAFKYYDLFKGHGPRTRLAEWEPLLRLRRRRSRPLLITATEIQVNQLRAENGDDPARALAEMDKKLELHGPDVFQLDFLSIPIGFELKGVLSTKSLLFEYLPRSPSET